MRPTSVLTMVILLTGLSAGGCGRPEAIEPDIGHYLSSPRDVDTISRVVFIELACDPASRSIAPHLTQAIFEAVQSRRRFRLDVLSRDDPRCRDLPLATDRSPTLREMRTIRNALDCDAVLFGSARSMQPFPRMQVELYLRLLDLREGRVIWAIDHTWDTTRRTTEARVRRYAEMQLRSGYGPADWRVVLMSPRHFSEFVAHEAGGTLDPPPEPEQVGLRIPVRRFEDRPTLEKSQKMWRKCAQVSDRRIENRAWTARRQEWSA